MTTPNPNMTLPVYQENKDKIILDLCGGTGSWSKPYKEAGYDVRLVTLPGQDIRTYSFPKNVYGILAAPPCTDLAGSGARWWAGKGHGALLEALAVADACTRVILLTKPKFWVLENPVGRLSKYYGKPMMTFQPCDYGDPYTKRTCLWGSFKIPKKKSVKPTEGGKIWRMPPSEKRQELRSITPAGFAKAFYEANK
jgi:hypothetical protein